MGGTGIGISIGSGCTTTILGCRVQTINRNHQTCLPSVHAVLYDNRPAVAGQVPRLSRMNPQSKTAEQACLA